MNALRKRWFSQSKEVGLFLLFSLALLPSLACGMAESLLGESQSAGTVSELWDDVPALEDANPSDLEMPLAFRLMIQAMSRGGIDYIAYTTDQTPDDVKAFYTVERMAENGWQAADLDGNETDELSCVGDTSDTSSTGVLCLFARQEDTDDILLAIVVAQNAETQQTDVFYARINASQFETPAAGETTLEDATTPLPTVPLIENTLPTSPIREFVYAGVNFKVTQAVITNRDPFDPTLILSDAVHVELTLSAENSTRYVAIFEAGQLQLKFGDGTAMQQPFGDVIGSRETREYTLSGPVSPQTTWEGAILTLDETDKEPISIPLTGDVPTAVSPVLLSAGEPVTGQNESGQTVIYQVTQATLNVDGLNFNSNVRAPIGKRFLKVTVHVTNEGASSGITVGGSDFRIRADGALSDMVSDETGVIVISMGSETDTTFWFLIPARAQELILVANVWGATAEIPLNRQ